MKIELRPMPEQRDVTVVGTLDGEPLVYVGRKAWVGSREYAHGDIADALVEAVERAATAVLGGEWSKPLALVTGLNQRTCNRDRIRQWGLPPWVLVLLGKAAADPDARALGDILQGVARVYDAKRKEMSSRLPEGSTVIPRERLKAFEGHAGEAFFRSLDILRWAREERETARVLREAHPFG